MATLIAAQWHIRQHAWIQLSRATADPSRVAALSSQAIFSDLVINKRSDSKGSQHLEPAGEQTEGGRMVGNPANCST